MVQMGKGVVVVDVVSEVGTLTPMMVVQSTVTCVTVDAVMVTTLVVGQLKSMVMTPGQGTVTAVAGVLKETTEDGGQDTVVGLTTEGKVTVAVVGPVAVKPTEYGVTNGTISVPFTTPPPTPPPAGFEPHGPAELGQPSGGPLLMAGHGGRLRVRGVGWPSGPVTSTVTGATGTLLVGTNPNCVFWSEVTLTLEKPIESVVMAVGWTVIVVVVPTPEPTWIEVT